MMILFALLAALQERSSDWPQYMRTSEHSGDAAQEILSFPLGLVARIRLEDAVLSSPAVVGERAYVVDQLGTAYAIEWRTGRIVWKASPGGASDLGSNTSSPCVARGRIYYGTVGGRLHVLDAATGRLIRSVRAGPITGSPTFANDSIYFQTLDAVLHCLDLDGNARWTWDHYKRYVEPRPERFKGYHPGGYDGTHFGGGEVAVSGRRVVTSFGWDHVCLEDKGDDAALAWCNRAPVGKDDGIPLHSSISGGSVYTGIPGVDAAGTLLRVSLADGTFDPKKDHLGRDRWAVFGTPAARGDQVFFGRHVRGVVAHEFGKGTLWESFRWSDPANFTPVVGSPVLTKEHCVFATVEGEVVAVPIAGQGSGLDRMKPAPFRWKSPGGKFINGAPAVSQGHLFFGSDDGHLYVLGPGGAMEAKEEKRALHEARSRCAAPRYAWPSPYGGPANANFVEDPALKGPLRLRWAVRSHGVFVAPLSATEDDLVGVTLEGTVLCLEQETGRLRWRRRLPPADQHITSGALCLEGRIYVPRPASKSRGILYCLDQATGDTVWTAALGGSNWYARGAPVWAEGLVGVGHLKGEPPAPVVEAFDAKTGKALWEVKLEKAQLEPHGCSADGTFVFSAGVGRNDAQGETVAIEAKTGRVLWRSTEAHCGYRGTPSSRDGRAYLSGWSLPVTCISVADGKVLWRTEQKMTWGHVPALGPDFFSGRGYSGHAASWSLEDGKPRKHEGKQVLLGGPDHACGPVLFTSGGASIAVTVSGLYVRDAATGRMLWQSPGFAPRSCSSPIAASGRIFYNPQANGMLYCFEPAR